MLRSRVNVLVYRVVLNRLATINFGFPVTNLRSKIRCWEWKNGNLNRKNLTRCRWSNEVPSGHKKELKRPFVWHIWKTYFIFYQLKYLHFYNHEFTWQSASGSAYNPGYCWSEQAKFVAGIFGDKLENAFPIRVFWLAKWTLKSKILSQ